MTGVSKPLRELHVEVQFASKSTSERTTGCLTRRAPGCVMMLAAWHATPNTLRSRLMHRHAEDMTLEAMVFQNWESRAPRSY